MATGTVNIEGRANLAEISRSVADIQRKFGRLEKQTERVSKEVRGLGVAIGAQLAGHVSTAASALSDLVHETLTARLEVANLATATGVSAEMFGTLQHAAERAGIGADAVAGALKALNATAFEAATAGGSAADKFAAIGVSVTDASGALKDNQTLFEQTITALGAIANESERAGMANAIFGEAAYGLNAALGELSKDGLEAATARAVAFTSHLNAQGIESAERYAQTMGKIEIATQSLGNMFGGLAAKLDLVVDPLVFMSVFLADFTNQVVGNAVATLKVFGEGLLATGKSMAAVANRDLAGLHDAVTDFNDSFRTLMEANPAPSFNEAIKRATNVAAALDKATESSRALGQQARETGTDFNEGFGQYIDPLTGEIINQTVETNKRTTAQQGFNAAIKNGAIALQGYQQAQQGAAAANQALALSQSAATSAAAGAYGYGVALELVGETATDFQHNLDMSAERLARVRDESIAANEALAELEKAQRIATFQQTASVVGNVATLVGELANHYLQTGVAAENMTEKQRAAAMRAFRVQQAAAMATAVLQTAAGITQALGAAPPPVNFINAGITAALGGVQIATIASQKPSFALGGVMPSTGGNAILHPGEGVLSAGAVDSMGGASALAAANSRTALAAPAPVVVQWRHLRRSFDLEMRDAGKRAGSTREIRRDGRRAGQTRGITRAHYGDL